MKAGFGKPTAMKAPKKGASGPNGSGGGTRTYKPAMPKPQHNVGPTSGKHKNAR